VKHQIKAVDRLLGNEHLQRERDGIYRAIAGTLLLGNKRPVILVDWSDLELGRQWVMLKAAVPVGGRAISLYERVFPFKRYNSPGAHREFLQALRAILPEGCQPIIVTDAGFRGPWFREVESYGWDWVERIRNKIKYYREETGRWCFTNSLYPEATSEPRYVGEVALSRRHQYRFRLYLVRAHKPRIGRPPRRGPTRSGETMYRRLHRAPWLLATSLPHDPSSPRRIMRLYAQRMQMDRGNFSRREVPSLGLRPPLGPCQQRWPARDLAAARRTRNAHRVARWSRRSRIAVEPAPAGQHRAHT
jgi:hypothetical protein